MRLPSNTPTASKRENPGRVRHTSATGSEHECVLDLFDSGEISSNLVEISDDLVELFGRYWERVLPFTRPGNLALPFSHLQGDGFWHLLPRHESTLFGSQITSLTRLREEIVGARMDENLYDLIRSEENRDRLRSVLIETYFSRD